MEQTANSLKPSIVLFYQDLRLEDQPALHEAAKRGAPLLLVFVDDPERAGAFKIGGASNWWQMKALKSLNDQLQKLGHQLLYFKGDTVAIIKDLIAKTGAESLFWNRAYEPHRIELGKQLKSLPLHTQSFNGSLLLEPWEIATGQGTPFRVFTPFWKTLCKLLESPKTLPVPSLPKSYQGITAPIPHYEEPAWSRQMHEVWEVGEDQALKRLNDFLQNSLENYEQARDVPRLNGTSSLSPYLHFGHISPKQIWVECQQYGSKAEKFLSEIGWREFSYHLLFHFPDLPTANFNPRFDAFKWVKNPEGLKAWKKGETGIPIVDAGMRQLWHTGWMHNRVRMIVASFLTKDLRIHWHEGAEWFWDTLVDADLASNSASWQWVAGTGADAAPYFRIFNPYLQGKKFDPDGSYVRKWVPELAALSGEQIHEPHLLPSDVLRGAGITLGVNYPRPIVDHREASKQAMNVFQALK